MNPAPPVTKTLLPIILSGLLDSDPRLSLVGVRLSLDITISIGDSAKGLKRYELPLPFFAYLKLELAQDLKKQILKKPYSERKVVFQKGDFCTLKSNFWAIIEVE